MTPQQYYPHRQVNRGRDVAGGLMIGFGILAGILGCAGFFASRNTISQCSSVLVSTFNAQTCAHATTMSDAGIFGIVVGLVLLIWGIVMSAKA